MKRQRGQSMVEFAIIMPLFIFLFMAIVYTAMLFSDYLSLSNIARDSARQAAISSLSESEIQTKYQDASLNTNLYIWSSQGTMSVADAADGGTKMMQVDFYKADGSVITDLTKETVDYVTVTLRAEKNPADKSDFMNWSYSLPQSIRIKYTMHKG